MFDSSDLALGSPASNCHGPAANTFASPIPRRAARARKPRSGKQAADNKPRLVAGREPHKRRAAPKLRRGTGMVISLTKLEATTKPQPLPPIGSNNGVTTPAPEPGTEAVAPLPMPPPFQDTVPAVVSRRRPSMLRGQAINTGRKKKRKTLGQLQLQQQLEDEATFGSFLAELYEGSEIGFDELPPALVTLQLKPMLPEPKNDAPTDDDELLSDAAIATATRNSFQFTASKSLRAGDEFDFNVDTESIGFLTEFISRGFERLRALVGFEHTKQVEAEATRRKDLQAAIEWINEALLSRVQRRCGVIEQKRCAARFFNEQALERLREELLLLEFDADEEEDELRECEKMIQKLQSAHVIYEAQADARRCEDHERRCRMEDNFIEKVDRRVKDFLAAESDRCHYDVPALLPPGLLGMTVTLLSASNVPQLTMASVPAFTAALAALESPTTSDDASQTLAVDTIVGPATMNDSHVAASPPVAASQMAKAAATAQSDARAGTSAYMLRSDTLSPSEQVWHQVTHQVKRVVEHLKMQQLLLANRMLDHADERLALATEDAHVKQLHDELEPMRKRMEFHHVINEQIARRDRAMASWLAADEVGDKQALWLKIYDREICKQFQLMRNLNDRLVEFGVAFELTPPTEDIKYIEEISSASPCRTAERAEYEGNEGGQSGDAPKTFQQQEMIKAQETEEAREDWFAEKMKTLKKSSERRAAEKAAKEAQLLAEKLETECLAREKKEAEVAAYLKMLEDERLAREGEAERLEQEAAQAAVNIMKKEQREEKAAKNRDWVKQKLETMRKQQQQKMLATQKAGALKRAALKMKAANFIKTSKQPGASEHRQSRMSIVEIGMVPGLKRKSQFEIVQSQSEAMVQPAVRMAKMLPKKMPPMGENEALETKKEQTQKRKDNAMARRVVDQVDSLLNNVAGHLGMSLDDMDKRREMMRKVWEQVNNDPDLFDIEIASKFDTFAEFSQWLDENPPDSDSEVSEEEVDENRQGNEVLSQKKRPIPAKAFTLQLSDEESDATRMIKKRLRKKNKKKKVKVYVHPAELESIFSQLVEMELEFLKKKEQAKKDFDFDEGEYYNSGEDDTSEVSKIGQYADMLTEKLKQKKKRPKRQGQARKPAKFEFNSTVEMLQKHCTLDLFKMKYLTNIWADIVGEAQTMTMSELAFALQKVNKHLIGKDVLKYLFFVLDLIGSDGEPERVVDFKLFAAIAALSEKTAPMEDLYNDFLDTGDLGSLKMKMDLAHRMFAGIFMADDEFFLDGIPLRLLEVELFAGGYSRPDIAEILGALRANSMDPMTFLDYLVYVPMFVEIHKKIMETPIGWQTGL